MTNTRASLVSLAALTFVVTLSAACGGGGGGKGTPVDFSEPVGISFSAHKQDIDNATNLLSLSKNVNTESGNPFGKFVNDAQATLSGADPSSVGLTSLVLTLSSSSTVTGLEQVFGGPVSIVFAMSTSSASYPVGTVAAVTGTSATLTQNFDTAVMTSSDYAAFLGGQFKVMVEGSAAASFHTGNPSADLVTTFGFVAYQ